MKRSLYWRIVTAIVAVLLLANLLSAVLTVFIVRGVARRAQEQFLTKFADFAARQIESGLTDGRGPVRLPRVVREAFKQFPEIEIAYAPAGGRPMMTRDAEPELVQAASRASESGLVSLPPWPRRAGVSVVKRGGRKLGAVGVTLKRRHAASVIALVGWLGLLSIPLTFVVSAVAALLALRFLRRRLDPISEVLARLRAGDLAVRLPETETADEIGELSLAFNGMAIRVEETVSRLEQIDRMRREFLVEVAHELKTPLTAVEGSLEQILSRRRERGADDGHLSRAYGESVRIRGLVADLLESARMEEPRYSLNRAPVNLQRLLSRVIERYFLLFERRRFEVRTRFGAEPILAAVDERRMEQVVGNLFQNALDHSGAAGGTIDVSVEARESWIVIELADDGEGMPAEKVQRVCGESPASMPAVAGAGLPSGVGLIIVRKLVEMHGGRLEIASRRRSASASLADRDPTGTTVRIWLPT